MTNIGILIGTGGYGEDVLHKYPWISYLDKSHNVHVVSRVNPDVHLDLIIEKKYDTPFFIRVKKSINGLKNISKTFTFVYDSPYLQKKYSPQEIDEIQSWLGISFEFIAALDRRFFDKETHKESRNRNSLINNITGLVKLYSDLFSDNKIEILINTLEDDIFSTTAYYVAKKMNIEIIGLTNGRFPKRGVMFCKDFKDIYVWNEPSSDLGDIQSLFDHNSIVGKEALERNLKNLKIFKIKKILAGINNFKTTKKIMRTYPYESNILYNRYVINGLKMFIRSQINSRVIKHILDKPDYDEKYFLFPLHYTEDAQITFREPFLHQFHLIYNISKSLPYGYKLYIKSHPHFSGSDVSPLKLLELSKLHDVKIISHEIPPIELIKHAQGVITINSTTGFEALVLKKPVITFGHDFYCRNDIVHTVSDLNTLPQILMESMNHCKKDENEIKKFIISTYSNTIWITGCKEPTLTFELSDEDGQHIAIALNTILKIIILTKKKLLQGNPQN